MRLFLGNDEGLREIGVVVALVGLALVTPALLRLAGRLLLGAAKRGARGAGKVGRELRSAYKEGRNG